MKTTGSDDCLSLIENVRSLVVKGIEGLKLEAVDDDSVRQLLPGKMLRTRLAARLMATRAVAAEAATRLCAATEMAHTASLCHDDVIDNALIRRGLPTLWSVSSTSAAVLVGDLLLCEAMRLVLDTDGGRHVGRFVQSLREVCRAEAEQELLWRGRTADVATCLRLARGKTGPLFAFAASICAEPGSALALALAEAGYRIGAAYQLADDLVDINGDEAAVGKTLGTDAARGKVTLAQLDDGRTKVLIEQVSELCCSALALVTRWPEAQAAVATFLAKDLQPVLDRHLNQVGITVRVS